jgi:sulfite reductase alpha subunit-like flavoprotein
MIDFVTDLLKKKINEFEVEIQNDNNNSVSLHEKLMSNLEKKLNDIQARELSQWEAQSDPDPAKRMPQHIFQALNAKLVKEREETEKSLEQARKSMPTKIDYEQKLITFQKALDALNDTSKSAAEKNKLLKQCIKRITYNRTEGKRRMGTWDETPIELDVQLML